jgi:peptidase M23B
MSRRPRRSVENGSDVSKFIIVGGIVAVIAAFIISYIVYSQIIAKRSGIKINNTQKIAQSNESSMINIISNTQEVTSQIGKSVNDISKNETTDSKANENKENKTNNESKQNNTSTDTKVAINTSKAEEKNSKNENSEKDGQNQESAGNTETKETKDPSFAKPVEGEKQKDYSKDNLVYSSTLQEWTVHNGIDFLAEKTDVVKASADGKIKSIKNDPRYGLTVVIEHENGFETIYSSLLTAEFVTVGEEVKQGQTIATVGNTATFEIADNTHLHFEMKQNGENIDPNIYLK